MGRSFPLLHHYLDRIRFPATKMQLTASTPLLITGTALLFMLGFLELSKTAPVFSSFASRGVETKTQQRRFEADSIVEIRPSWHKKWGVRLVVLKKNLPRDAWGTPGALGLGQTHWKKKRHCHQSHGHARCTQDSVLQWQEEDALLSARHDGSARLTSNDGQTASAHE